MKAWATTALLLLAVPALTPGTTAFFCSGAATELKGVAAGVVMPGGYEMFRWEPQDKHSLSVTFTLEAVGVSWAQVWVMDDGPECDFSEARDEPGSWLYVQGPGHTLFTMTTNAGPHAINIFEEPGAAGQTGPFAFTLTAVEDQMAMAHEALRAIDGSTGHGSTDALPA